MRQILPYAPALVIVEAAAFNNSEMSRRYRLNHTVMERRHGKESRISEAGA